MKSTESDGMLNLAGQIAELDSENAGMAKLKLVEKLAKTKAELDKLQVTGDLYEKSPDLSLSDRAEIDAVLIGAGFDPGISYIQRTYGDNWSKPAINTAIDFAPLLDGFSSIVTSLLQQSNRDMVEAIAGIASQISGNSIAQDVLLAALTEARKPISLDIKLTAPEQKPRRFVAEKSIDGKMTLTEEIDYAALPNLSNQH